MVNAARGQKDLQRSDTTSKVVFARSKESRVFHLLGLGLVVFLLLTFVWMLVSAFRASDVVYAIPGIVGIALIVPFFVILFKDYFRKIALLDKYISIESWHGVPRVYPYDQIVDIEMVVVDEDSFRWRGSHVKLTFADGTSVKISNGLVSARTFRKHLREKSGKTFRKKRKNRS